MICCAGAQNEFALQSLQTKQEIYPLQYKLTQRAWATCLNISKMNQTQRHGQELPQRSASYSLENSVLLSVVAGRSLAMRFGSHMLLKPIILL